MKTNKKMLSILLIGIFTIALTTALIVTYVSNTITGEVSVESPLNFSVSLEQDGTYSNSIVISDTMYGGETEVVYTKLENKAKVEILNKVVGFVITNSNGDSFEGSEFTIKAFTFANEPAGAVTCSANGTQLDCATELVSLAVGQTQEIKFEVTSDVAINPDTYTFSAKILA